MRRYKLVIFDFDGTLADSFDCFVSCINETAKRYRFKPLDITRLNALRNYNAREIMAYMGLSWWKVPMVTRAMRRLMFKRSDEVTAFDGVDQLFVDLKAAGLEIAIVTSNSEENVARVLGPRNFARIRYLSCDASILGKKSKLRAVLKSSGLTSNQVLCVGDETRDAEAAFALGMDFIGVSWGYTNPGELQRHTKTKLCAKMTDVLAFALPSNC